MTETWMISADSHLVEPPDLFQTRIDREYRDLAPRVVVQDGVDWWVMEGEEVFPAAGPSAAGDRFEEVEPPRFKFTEDVRPGAYDPDLWLQENEADGVYGGVLYPSLGCVFFSMANKPLLSAVCRAYNSWCGEFTGVHPDRLRGIAMISLDDVAESVEELERSKNLGLAGAMIPVVPDRGLGYDHERYEPFWAAAQDLEMPISLHIATNRTPGEWKLLFKTSIAVTAVHWVQESLANLIFAGVFERYPGLKVGSIEHEGGWVPYFINRMDWNYTELAPFQHNAPFKNGLVPSDFFRSNVYVSFQEDGDLMRNRDRVGVDSLLWGNDYPHRESTYPRSREILADRMADVPASERLKMTLTNVSALYGFGEPNGGRVNEPPS